MLSSSDAVWSAIVVCTAARRSAGSDRSTSSAARGSRPRALPPPGFVRTSERADYGHAEDHAGACGARPQAADPVPRPEQAPRYVASVCEYSADLVAAHEPGPHPEAPAEVAESFSQFRETHNSGPHFHPEKAGSSSGGAGGAPSGVANDIRELPPRFWDTLSLRIDEAEMEAIMVRALGRIRRRIETTDL